MYHLDGFNSDHLMITLCLDKVVPILVGHIIAKIGGYILRVVKKW